MILFNKSKLALSSGYSFTLPHFITHTLQNLYTYTLVILDKLSYYRYTHSAMPPKWFRHRECVSLSPPSAVKRDPNAESAMVYHSQHRKTFVFMFQAPSVYLLGPNIFLRIFFSEVSNLCSPDPYLT